MVTSVSSCSSSGFLSTPSARRATGLSAGAVGSRAFLSTPSARRATRLLGGGCLISRAFYPRPPRGGRQDHHPQPDRRDQISIHALREEGDTSGARKNTSTYLFLSTPSARRATCLSADGAGRSQPFLSTPSARRATCPYCNLEQSKNHFYPRPPRGGRLETEAADNRTGLFLSTPSARRATLMS